MKTVTDKIKKTLFRS